MSKSHESKIQSPQYSPETNPNQNLSQYCQETPETYETPRGIALNDIYYNCTECSSHIEILSINSKECSIEFKCINKNHIIKMPINDYISKMKRFNDKKLHNDICELHNKNKYACYCLDCNEHLCKECLILRNHINHNKNYIIEIKPNKNEEKIMEDITKFYEDKINDLEKEIIIKQKDFSDKLLVYTEKLQQREELKIKQIEENRKRELKIIKDKYILEINNNKNENIKNKKLIKYEYIMKINEINIKYKIMIDKVKIINNNKMEKILIISTKIIQQNQYNNDKLEKMKNLYRLTEIIKNTYNLYNNNYYNSLNFNNILIYFHKNKIYTNKELNEEFQNIMKIKTEKENSKNYEYQEKIKNYENIIKQIKTDYDTLKDKYQKEFNHKTDFQVIKFSNGTYEGEIKNGKREGKGIMYYNDGNRYEGEFKNGQREGKGIMYYKDGDRYEGEFKNGKKHGKGIYYYNNGDREMGDYYKGVEYGILITLTFNGKIITKNHG